MDVAPVRALLSLICAMVLTPLLTSLLAPAPAWAVTPIEDAQQAELERVRRQVAGQVQLSAYDLLDELVYGWMSEPVFPNPTPVVLAGVTVPVGLGTGMQALLENHLANLLIQNAGHNIQLVYCPSCTAVLVHSGPKGTVISRGIDNPELLQSLGGAGGKQALFIDVEAEGTWLVLRARLTELTPDLPIVWSRTLSISAGTPALLRQPQDLKSAAEARQEYLDILRARGPVAIPIRLGVRAYEGPDDGNIAAPPFLWLQSGVELGLNDARVWIASVMLGYSIIPQAYQGLMSEVRISRLVTGSYRSLTRPDLYAFGGAAIMTVWGPATGSFTNEALNAEDFMQQLRGEDPRAIFGTFLFGLDLRIGNRMGMSGFLETLPSFRNSENFGEYVNVAGLGFQSFGTEVTFWF
jgi:hypothetical protein